MNSNVLNCIYRNNSSNLNTVLQHMLPVCYSSTIRTMKALWMTKNTNVWNELKINLSIVVWLPIHLPVTTDLKARLCPTNSQSSPFLMTPLSKVPVTTVPLPERGMNTRLIHRFYTQRETWLDNSRQIRDMSTDSWQDKYINQINGETERYKGNWYKCFQTVTVTKSQRQGEENGML